MTEKILIAGSGGQGVMLLGKLLAEAAMIEGKFTTWLPAYGAEVRGGTAYCMVIISDEKISSPLIEKADTLILMNEPSFDRFIPRVKAKGLCIVNSSLVRKDKLVSKKYACQIKAAPFTEIALKEGNAKVANVIALGYYNHQKSFLSALTLKEVIAKNAPKNKDELIKINLEALNAGALAASQEER